MPLAPRQIIEGDLCHLNAGMRVTGDNTADISIILFNEEQAEMTRKKLAELDQMGEKEKTEEKHSRLDADTKRVNDEKAGEEEEEGATGATL